MTDADRLSDLADRLERAAAKLRAPGLDPDDAAALADECARLAAEAGAELDRQARALDAGPGPEQASLL